MGPIHQTMASILSTTAVTLTYVFMALMAPPNMLLTLYRSLKGRHKST